MPKKPTNEKCCRHCLKIVFSRPTLIFLWFFSCTSNYELITPSQTNDWSYLLTTLLYDLEIVAHLPFAFLQNALFEERNRVSDMSNNWLFPPSYETRTFSQSIKRSSDLDLPWNFM